MSVTRYFILSLEMWLLQMSHGKCFSIGGTLAEFLPVGESGFPQSMDTSKTNSSEN